MKKRTVIIALCAILCVSMIVGQPLLAAAAGDDAPSAGSSVTEGVPPVGEAEPTSSSTSQPSSVPVPEPESSSAPPSEAPDSSEPSPAPSSSDVAAAEYTLTYTMRAGDLGELSFSSAAVEAGAPIGTENIPALALPEDWTLVGYAVADTIYTAEQLAGYVPKADVAVEVRTQKAVNPNLDPNAPIEDDAGGDAAYWESPPAWAQAGQTFMQGNLATAAAIKAAHASLENRIAFIAQALHIPGEYPIERGEDNFHEALAVYAIRHGQTGGFPYGVAIGSEKDAADLRSIYWSLNAVNAAKTGDGSVVRVSRLSGADVFGLAGADRAAFNVLTTGENKAKVQALLANSILGMLQDAEYADIAASIPAGLSAERRAVLLAALSLEGKVGYFWGGKSVAIGWDESWGQTMTVAAEGDETTGTDLPFGLDASGLVSWAFIAAGGSADALAYIGNGTANQYRNSFAVDWNTAKPGDLVFCKNPAAEGANHVGIVLSVDASGAPAQIIHCTRDAEGVTVSGAEGFTCVRRPFIYGE